MPMFRVAGIFNFYLRNEGAPNGARLPVLAIARSDANDVKAAVWYRDNNGMINYTSLNEMKRTHRAPYDSSTWSAYRWHLALNVS